MDLTIFQDLIPTLGQDSLFGISIGAILIIAIAINIIKGLALWKAVEVKQKGWFWILIFVNTMGILDLLYLAIFSKRRK